MRHPVPLLILGLAIAVIFQANAEPVPPADRIDRLIGQLGSGDCADREKAMTGLAAIGGSGLDALRKAAQSNDLEIRRRAEELIRQIELREESARLLGGKRIRLSFQDSPVDEALVELNRLTGFAWRINPADLPQFAEVRITLQTGDITIWEAFDKFCAKARLVVPELGSAAAKSASLLPGTAPALPTCYSGAVRIRAVSSSTPGWGRTTGVFEVSIPLEVATEPKLQWHGVADVVIHSAVDDKGQELEQSTLSKDGPDNTWDQPIQWGGRQGIWRKRDLMERELLLDLSDVGHGKQVNVRLKLGTEPARFIKQMQGTLVAQMDTPPETLAEVTDILRATGQTVTAKDGSVLKFGEIKKETNGTIQIPIELQAALADDFQMMAFPINNRRLVNQAIIWQLRAEVRGSAAVPQIELRDAEGRLFEIVRYNEASQINANKSQYVATLHAIPPKGVGEPAKLLLIGRRTVTVEVPFTLNDIPLP